jgi:hypothetical protein
MKVIQISTKVQLVRHWFVWYRVQRGAAQWQKLKPFIDKTPDLSTSNLDRIDNMTPEQAKSELEKRF